MGERLSTEYRTPTCDPSGSKRWVNFFYEGILIRTALVLIPVLPSLGEIDKSAEV